MKNEKKKLHRVLLKLILLIFKDKFIFLFFFVIIFLFPLRSGGYNDTEIVVQDNEKGL